MAGLRRALTLIELTIVILIIGITAAIATPRLAETMRAVRLEAAAIDLATHIDYVRSIAINQSRTTSLVCDNQIQVYRSPDVDFPQRPGEPLHVSLRDAYDPAFRLQANFNGQSTLSFDFEGTPMVAGDELESGFVTLRYGGDAFRVVIASGTGETTIQRVSGSMPAGGESSAEASKG